MHPFFNIFGLTISSYGIMMLAGLGIAMLLLMLRSEKFNVTKLDSVLVACMAFAGVITGGLAIKPIMNFPRLVMHWDLYSKVPLGEFLSGYFGEFVFYGGLIGGAIAVIWFCRHYKMSVPDVAGLAAPVIPIAHAFGRVGCLLTGCCYGMEVSASHPLAVVYPERAGVLGELGAPAGVPLLAVPLIEAGGNLIIAGIILLLERKIKISGFGVLIYGMLYAVQRFFLEFYRGDPMRGFYGPLTTSQIISLVVFTFCAVLAVISICKSAAKAKRTAADVQ